MYDYAVFHATFLQTDPWTRTDLHHDGLARRPQGPSSSSSRSRNKKRLPPASLALTHMEQVGWGWRALSSSAGGCRSAHTSRTHMRRRGRDAVATPAALRFIRHIFVRGGGRIVSTSFLAEFPCWRAPVLLSTTTERLLRLLDTFDLAGTLWI